jgi:hypothetical protein
MLKHIGRIGLASCALTLIACAASRGASLIVDGGFENPTVPVAGYTQFLGGSTMGAWKVLGNDVLLINSLYSEPGNGILAFNAQEGVQSLDLTGAGNTSPTDGVSQSVATVVGQKYQLTFWVGTASGFSPYYTAPATDNVSIDLGAQVSFTNPNQTPYSINWQQFTYNFVAATSTTNIAFLNGTTPPTAEAGLDNVSLVAVPLPSSTLSGVLLLGIVAFGKYRSARRA